MEISPLVLLIKTIADIFVFIFVLRFLLQLSNADYYNPIVQGIVRITRTPLLPFQKVLPRTGRVDVSPLLLALIVEVIKFVLLFHSYSHIGIIAMMSVISLLRSILNLYFYLSLGAVIISWVAPSSYHPAPQLILQLTEPLFGLVRKVLPPMGGLDFSPIVIFLVIQVALGFLPHI